MIGTSMPTILVSEQMEASDLAIFSGCLEESHVHIDSPATKSFTGWTARSPESHRLRMKSTHRWRSVRKSRYHGTDPSVLRCSSAPSPIRFLQNPTVPDL